jgi:hypothetical protein
MIPDVHRELTSSQILLTSFEMSVMFFSCQLSEERDIFISHSNMSIVGGESKWNYFRTRKSLCRMMPSQTSLAREYSI